jgi:hypothetical protein
MGTPESWTDIVMLPGILVFLGAMMWLGSWLGGLQKATMNPWRWIAVVPMAIGLIIGMRYMWEMYNPDTGAFYMESMRVGQKLSRRLLMAHYGAFFIPLVSILIVVLWDKLEIRRRRRLEDY